MNQRRFGGKSGSRRHSTTSFSENVEVAETSYQMFTEGNSANFSSEKMVRWRYLGSLYFENTRKNVKSNIVLVVVLVVESEALYCVWLLQLAC